MVVGRGLTMEWWIDGMLKMRTTKWRTWVRGVEDCRCWGRRSNALLLLGVHVVSEGCQGGRRCHVQDVRGM